MEKNSEHISTWITLLVFSFMISSQFSIDILGLRFSVYRIVLLLASLPVAMVYFSRTKKLLVDRFVFVTAGLMFVSLLVNHGADGIASGGATILETIVPYLLGRVYINNKENLIKFADLYYKVILLLLIPVTYELFTGYNLFINTFGGEVIRNGQSVRFGLYRAEGPFDHAILFGLFVASAFAIASISNKNVITKYLIILAVTFTSVSSAAFLMIAMQIALLKIKKLANARLSSIAYVIIGVYIFINIFSNRTPFEVLSSYLSLDTETAYYRLLINQYAMVSVMNNPFFGIGLHDWVRPSWLAPSIDNFWMLIAVQFGIATFACLCIVIYFSLKSTYVNSTTRESVGIRALLFSIIIAAITVALWNALYVLFWLIIGLSNNLAQFKPSDQNL